MKLDLNYMKKTGKNTNMQRVIFLLFLQKAVSAFAETKAKFYEKSSLHSDQERIKKENKKREAKIQQYKVLN